MGTKPAGKYLQRQNGNWIETPSQEKEDSGLRAGESGRIMISKKLLIESTPVTLSLIESAGNKVIARGEFGRCNVPTQNGRIYPEEIMEREIRRLDESLSSRRVLGELDHPSDGKTSLKRVSHVITSLSIKDGIVIGEAEILNTPEGKTLKALIEANVQVGVSSRGYGSTAPARGQQEGEEVQEDFVLKTYDFVADPAMKSAIPGIYTEDIDDPTLAEMFMSEFPNVADEILSGKTSALEEEKEGVSRAAIKQELSENYERKLRDAIVEIKEEVRASVIEEASADPAVAGAKGVLAAISELVAVYHNEPDEKDVKAALKASELEVSEAKRERDEAIKEAEDAKCWLEIEKKISGHPMNESLRKLMEGRSFESKESAMSALEVLLKDMPGDGEVVRKEEAKLREDNAELQGKITLLESKVEELTGRLSKAVTLSERIDAQRRDEIKEAEERISELEELTEAAISEAAKAKEEAEEATKLHEEELESEKLLSYKLKKVVERTNGRKLMALLEGVHDRSKVDEMVQENQGLMEVSDPVLRKMQESLHRGKTYSKEVLIEETPPRKKRSIIGNIDLDEAAHLAGILGTGN